MSEPKDDGESDVIVRGQSPLGLIREARAATLTEAARLTDEQLAEIEMRLREHSGLLMDASSADGGPRSFDNPLAADVRLLLTGLRAARALLADLKADGCPWMDEPQLGTHVCAYCEAPVICEPGREPRADHRPMEDGKPCLWVRIEGA